MKCKEKKKHLESTHSLQTTEMATETRQTQPDDTKPGRIPQRKRKTSGNSPDLSFVFSEPKNTEMRLMQKDYTQPARIPQKKQKTSGSSPYISFILSKPENTQTRQTQPDDTKPGRIPQRKRKTSGNSPDLSFVFSEPKNTEMRLMQKDYTQPARIPQKKQKTSGSSPYISFILSKPENTQTRQTQPDDTKPGRIPQRKRKTSGNSPDLSFVFSEPKNTEMRLMQKDYTQPARIPQKKQKTSGSSPYISFILSKPENTRIIDSDENSPQPGPSGLTQAHIQTGEDLDSEYSSSASFEDKLDRSEFCKSQENAPEISLVVLAQDQETEENSSACEYFSCFSSASKLVLVDEDGVSCIGPAEMSRPQDSEQRETYSSLPHTSVHSHFMSSEHKEKKMAMKIYYMCVPMKRGVAVLSDTEEGLEPPQKKTRVEEMPFPDNVNTKATISDMSTKDLLADSECPVDSKAQEERKEEADSPAEPPAPEESSRARTPETLNSGFKCVACCRVYPSLEVLQMHVEHGVHEGFSCRTFHLAFARLKNKRNRKGKKNEIKATTSVRNREEHFDEETSSSTSTD